MGGRYHRADRFASCMYLIPSEPLIPHLRTDHKIEPEVFRARFPEHPLCSERFAGFLAAHNVRKVNECLHYRLEVAGCPMTARYGVEHPLIPQPDPTFVWPLTRREPRSGIGRAATGGPCPQWRVKGWTDPARDVAEAVEHNERVFLYGPSGTGKLRPTRN
ncbi:MAG TPA: hypothetical protein PLL20_14795 [Phycisphaerae bacterium]|nr:hypothetical protein [Phycisphaerae bacterium]HRR84350.1 hypothetical protein [Phycisphaerae bacterium]